MNHKALKIVNIIMIILFYVVYFYLTDKHKLVRKKKQYIKKTSLLSNYDIELKEVFE